MGLGDYIKTKVNEKVQSERTKNNENREHKEELREIREKSRWEETKSIAKKQGRQEAHGGRTIHANSGLNDMGFFLGSKPKSTKINASRNVGQMVHGSDMIFGDLGYGPSRNAAPKKATGNSKTITVKINMPKSKEDVEAEKEKKRRSQTPDYMGLGF